MHLNRDTAITRELTELTAAELDVVSGGATAAAAAGDTAAGAAAADFVLDGGSLAIGLGGLFNFVAVSGPVDDVSIAGGDS